MLFLETNCLSKGLSIAVVGGSDKGDGVGAVAGLVSMLIDMSMRIGIRMSSVRI